MKKISLVVLLAAIFVLAVFLFHGKRHSPAAAKTDRAFSFGPVLADRSRKTVEFSAVTALASGRVDFLVYVDGYRWLKKSCALRGEAKLRQLQDALAFVDWEFWDKLWTGGGAENAEMFVEWDGKRKKAAELVETGGEALSLKDLVFPGSPYFDPAVLEDNTAVDCEKCPVYKIEESALRKVFRRSSGRTGYMLNPGGMPPAGTKVRVTIEVK